MTVFATAAIGLALVLDSAVGEPPERWHPVVALGTVIDRLDREWKRPALVGALVAVVLPVVYGLLAAGLVAA
ncbi:MAG: cobalamin biosynthesis protein, partial [Halanaeroarchaeum sp.]